MRGKKSEKIRKELNVFAEKMGAGERKNGGKAGDKYRKKRVKSGREDYRDPAILRSMAS